MSDRILVYIMFIIMVVLVTTIAFPFWEDDPKKANVQGKASAEYEPDIFTVRISTQAEAESASEAEEEANNKMESVRQALEDAGLEEDSIKRHSYDVMPNYNRIEGERIQDSYTARQSLNIESSQVEDVGLLLDAAVRAGADSVNRLNFDLSDEAREENKEELISQAMENAESKATSAVSASNQRLLKPLEINLEQQGFSPYRAQLDSLEEADAAGDRVDIEEGFVEQEVAISVSFEIR